MLANKKSTTKQQLTIIRIAPHSIPLIAFHPSLSENKHENANQICVKSGARQNHLFPVGLVPTPCPQLPPKLEENPRHGHKSQRDKGKNKPGPLDAQILVHAERKEGKGGAKQETEDT